MRVRLELDVAYGEDLEKVEKVLFETAMKSDFILKEPVPVISFRAFRAYSIHVQLIFWIDEPQNKGLSTSRMIKQVYAAFRKNKIRFPYPVQDINLRKMGK
ncbi:MAG: mechanosensitive ion channel, partial [Candidatus Woesearchaeota archaeon]|nr:mechanosensitive ion channel [Candidatus Woesearchaeota archaeon]